MGLDTYLYTNQGGRSYNEDKAEHKLEGEHGFFVLADGLGGHGKGDKASACVVQSMLDGYVAEEYHDDDWFQNQIEQVNEKLTALQKEIHHKMKSTIVVLAVDERSAAWAHVGDSRLYYLSEGRIKAITADHSVAYMKYLTGEISREEINMDADQSSLLRSMGGNKHTPDVFLLEEHETLKDGDGFLLCSDGLWEYLYDEEILIDYHKAESAMEWAEWMLLRVMTRVPEDHDNLTLITVLVEED